MSDRPRFVASILLGLSLLVASGIEPAAADISADGTGDELTLVELHALSAFAGLDPNQFVGQKWVDPYLGDDGNPGTYAAPLRSFRMIKQACIDVAGMRCTVKGRNRAFSPRTLTVAYSSGGPFVRGEAVQTTSPTAAGVVVAVEGSHVVLSITTPPTNVWGRAPTAPEPRDGTVVRGLSSTAIATVIDFEDTIVGLHSVLFGPGDITPGNPAVVSVDRHGYSNGDGPFMWLNEIAMPATVGAAVVEFHTRLYVCSTTPSSFQLSFSPTCVGNRVAIQSVGSGLSQLIDYHALGVATPGDVALGAPAEMKCGASARDRICTLFESEFPDAPWIIDGGGYSLNELRAKVYPEAWPGAGTGASYNPVIGYLVGVANPNPDLSQGWFGVQNGTIQNLAMDALATTHGGKLVALNVTARGIRNGVSDRSQTGMANPAHQAHNSCIQITGTSTDPAATGAIAYWINAGGSWNYQGSHAGSGGCINVNQQGVLRIISRGTLSSDVFPTDTSCAGRPCQSSLIVNPTADLTILGPLKLSMGPLADANRFSLSGVGTASRFYRVLFHRRGAFSELTPVLPAFFNLPPLIAPRTSRLALNEVVFKSTERGALFSICEAEAGASREISGRNVVVEAVESETYQAVVADCGGSGCSRGDCGGLVEAIENTKLSMKGILDHVGREGLNDYFVQPLVRELGGCGTPGTFRGDLCDALRAAGLSTSQWSWFESRGEPPASGGDAYFVGLRSEIFPELVPDDSCLPEDVLGTRLCALRLIERQSTPEPGGAVLVAVGVVGLSIVSVSGQRARRR